MIKYHSLSTAIFAPGWTHECAKEKDKFEDRDKKFWDLLEPLLYHQGLSMTSVQEQDLNPGYGCDDKDKCWWINLCKQSTFPFRLNMVRIFYYSCCSAYLIMEIEILNLEFGTFSETLECIKTKTKRSFEFFLQKKSFSIAEN